VSSRVQVVEFYCSVRAAALRGGRANHCESSAPTNPYTRRLSGEARESYTLKRLATLHRVVAISASADGHGRHRLYGRGKVRFWYLVR